MDETALVGVCSMHTVIKDRLVRVEIAIRIMEIISINHGRLHRGTYMNSGLCLLGKKELDSIPNPVLTLLLIIFTPAWIHAHMDYYYYYYRTQYILYWQQ